MASSPDPAVSKLAKSILQKNVRLKAGERVTIEAWPHTLPYAVALAREARRIRAQPIILYEDEASYWDSIEGGEARLLGTAPGHEWAALAKTDVYIHMWGPGDRARLNTLPPKQAESLFSFNDNWYAVARKAGLRGLRLELGRPYPPLADAYGVDEQTWKDQVAAASLVDPSALAKRAAALVRPLQSGKRLRVRHSNGTDLTVGLAHYPVRTYDGRPRVGDRGRPYDLLANVPSGAIRVALDEKVADGTLVGNRTCYYEDGVAREPTFEFSGGKLTTARFASGGERFDKPFAKAGKGRDQPGFLAIGLNPQLHDTPQLEDIEAGATMVSVGGNRNLGGKNAAQFFGWAIVAGASLEIDGKPLKVPG
jgi:leucyl aminopeptidase (aminopeptidase T)